MKRRFLKTYSLALILLAGACSPKAEDKPVVNNTPAQPEAVSIGQTTPAVAPPPNAVAGPNLVTPVQMDVATTKRPVNAQGEPMSDLEFLNHLVHEVNESRISDVGIVQKTFKTEAEQMAYEEAQQKRKEPVHDLNELVSAGILKALPQAPAGQHYAIDTTTGKVVLQ